MDCRGSCTHFGLLCALVYKVPALWSDLAHNESTYFDSQNVIFKE